MIADFLHGFTIALAALAAVWLLMAGCLGFILTLDAVAERCKRARQYDAAVEEDRRNQRAWDKHTAEGLALAAEMTDMGIWELEMDL